MSLLPGAVIGDYAGLVKRRVAGDCSRYLFQLTRGESNTELDIDALEVGNETRMINDFHGVSAVPVSLSHSRCLSHPVRSSQSVLLSHHTWNGVLVSLLLPWPSPPDSLLPHLLHPSEPRS